MSPLPVELLPAGLLLLAGAEFAAPLDDELELGLVAAPLEPLIGPDGEVTPPVLLLLPMLLEPILLEPMLLPELSALGAVLVVPPALLPALCANAAGAKAATDRASPAPRK